MTKTEWSNLQIGSRVTTTCPDLANQEKSINYTGVVIRSNSNWSQVLVRWDNSKSEVWYGRLGIDIAKQNFRP